MLRKQCTVNSNSDSLHILQSIFIYACSFILPKEYAGMTERDRHTLLFKHEECPWSGLNWKLSLSSGQSSALVLRGHSEFTSDCMWTVVSHPSFPLMRQIHQQKATQGREEIILLTIPAYICRWGSQGKKPSS